MAKVILLFGYQLNVCRSQGTQGTGHTRDLFPGQLYNISPRDLKFCQGGISVTY